MKKNPDIARPRYDEYILPALSTWLYLESTVVVLVKLETRRGSFPQEVL